MHNGPIPDGLQVDHINGVRTDNRIENPRLVTPQGNSRNRVSSRVCRSGVCGVTYRKSRYEAFISVSGKRIHLGCFTTLEAATEARRVAEQQHNFSSRHEEQPHIKESRND